MPHGKLFNGIDIVSVKLVREKDAIYGAKTIRNPDELASIVKRFLADTDREVFLAINFSTANTINSIHIVSIGSLDKTIVHPREVFKAAILSNSSSIALAHNHPSGSLNPSPDDILITKKLVQCGEILDIKIIDHIIVADDQYLSFAERKIGGLG
ncbi:MAG: JAB domain-containing protein [Syntrophaceae bacterium]|nr:JAB domain-containing protein [Syntrophaceae bacterium]